MPVFRIELNDGRVFDVDAERQPTEQEFSAYLNSTPASQPAPNSRILTEEETRAKFPTIPEHAKTTYGGPAKTLNWNEDWRGPSQTIADIASEAFGIGSGDPSESFLKGITPEAVPTGAEITKLTGVPKAISIPSSAVAKGAAGLAQFLTSPSGITQGITAAMPGIGLAQKAKWVYDMAKGAGESAGDLSAKLEKVVSGKGTTDDWQTLAEDTANTLLMLYGAGKLSSHEFSQVTGVRAPLGRMVESDRTRYAKDLADILKKEEGKPIEGKTSVEQAATPIRKLGIQQVPVGAMQQPGIADLADAALKEAGQIVITGDKGQALGALRAAVGEDRIVPANAATPANREIIAGETRVRPTVAGLVVEPGFRRSASDMLLERSAPILPESTKAVIETTKVEQPEAMTQRATAALENVEQVKPSEVSNAIEERIEPKSSVTEHQQAGEGRVSTEASGGNRPEPEATVPNAAQGQERVLLEQPKKWTPKSISQAWNDLVTNAKDDLQELLANWDDVELSPDGQKIIGYPGRDSRYSKGQEGGKINVSKKSFFDWLGSDEPLDPKKYVQDQGWTETVQRVRERLGIKRGTETKPTPSPATVAPDSDLAIQFGAWGEDGKLHYSNQVIAVDSLKDASNKWNAFRERTGIASSETPVIQVVNTGTGEVVAKLSYNGRLWDASGKEIKPAPAPTLPTPETAKAKEPWEMTPKQRASEGWIEVWRQDRADVKDTTVGSHWGTKEQALAIAKRENEAGRPLGKLRHAFIQVKNPFKTYDGGFWEKPIAEAKAKGHDTVVYENEGEKVGGTSYIPLSKEQVREIPDLQKPTLPATARVEQQVPIPPRNLPGAGINSKDVARQYGMPEDFYGTGDEQGGVSSKYRTKEYDDAIEAEKRVAKLQGINGNIIRRNARKRTEAAFADLVNKARATKLEAESPPPVTGETPQQAALPTTVAEGSAQQGVSAPAPSAISETKLPEQKTQAAPVKGIITGRAIEKWADDTLRGGATHLGPDVLAAYVVKGAALIERGVIVFAEWSKHMLDAYGPAIEPHLKAIYRTAQDTVKRAPAGAMGTLRSARDIVEQRMAVKPTTQVAPAVAPNALTQATPTTQAAPRPTTQQPTRANVPSGLEREYKIFEPEKKKWPRIRELGLGIAEAFRTNFSSSFRPLLKLSKDIAKAYGRTDARDIAGIFEQLKGSSGKAEADVYRFDQDVTKVIGKNVKDFSVWLFLNRSLDRLRQDYADMQKALAGDETIRLNRRQVSDYTIPQLESKLSQLEASLGPETIQRFQQAGNKYQEHLDAALKLQVESGRMSQELYNAIKQDNQFYAPFKVMKWQKDQMLPEGSGRKVDTVAKYTKPMTGIHDPNFKLGEMLAAARQNIMVSGILADKAFAMQEIAKLAAQDTAGLFVKKLRPGEDAPEGMKAVNVHENGEIVRYATRPEVADAVQIYGKTGANLIGEVLRYFSIPFKAGATAMNVPFQVSNLLADVPRQTLVSKYGIRNVKDLYQYPADYANALLSVMLAHSPLKYKNQLYQDFLDSGAAGTTVQELLTPNALKWRDPNTMSKSKRVALGILYSPAEFSTAIEQLSKVVGIRRAMRFEGATSGKDLARRIPEAVTEVRRFSGSPDFGRQGKLIESAKLNLVYMFLNARIQGAVADVGRLIGRDGAKTAAVTWARTGLAIGVPTMLLYALNNSKEYKADYDNLRRDDKERYWHIPKNTFITNEDGEVMRDYWRIPKRESAKWVANMTESLINFVQTKDPKAFGLFAQNLIEDISPVNISGNTGQERLESTIASLNPVIKAPIELATGRNLYRHKDLITSDKMKVAPPEEQYTDRTPEIFVKAAQVIPDWMPEFARSPIKLDNLTRNLTAGLLTQFMSGKPVQGRGPVENIGLLQRFQRTPYQDNEAFNRKMQEMERESAKDYLTRYRAAKQIFDSKTNQSVVELVRQAKGDEKLSQTLVDMWTAKRNGITSKERQLIALPVEQRAKYLNELFAPMTKEQKRKAIVDLSKKRVLTDAVSKEMALQEIEARKANPVSGPVQ